MRLFAERGYQAVSVADIQVAAGMTAGSGALYKHFPTKQALLEAGIDRFIGAGRDSTLAIPDPGEGDLEGLFRRIGNTPSSIRSPTTRTRFGSPGVISRRSPR